jgi:hypothetical protein
MPLRNIHNKYRATCRFRIYEEISQFEDPHAQQAQYEYNEQDRQWHKESTLCTLRHHYPLKSADADPDTGKDTLAARPDTEYWPRLLFFFATRQGATNAT